MTDYDASVLHSCNHAVCGECHRALKVYDLYQDTERLKEPGHPCCVCGVPGARQLFYCTPSVQRRLVEKIGQPLRCAHKGIQ
jgi:hypothetical protein